MIELRAFQVDAAEKIADRFEAYRSDPLAVKPTVLVPFYQNLSAVTGAGKTAILAEAVERIRERLPVEPLVLWISKGRVVVWQTFHNLASGKYAGLISGCAVKPLLDTRPADIENSDQALVLIATVAKFNQKDKAEGDRRIYRVELDSADQSLWDQLRVRRDRSGRKRPLLVVYDEGHNLTDMQVDLLLEQGPDALIAASATLSVPPKLGPLLRRLREEKGWRDEDFTVSVPTSDVVEAGFIKKHIMLGGYVTPMEQAIDDLLQTVRQAETEAGELRLPFRPKAIYVSSTNAVDGATIKEDVARPFSDRRARPILIWRHLVESGGVDPTDIAVYCDLKFDKRLPPPAGFNLFSGGDKDYDRFISGGYRHIIFNLSLQEGWDDPACAFAYIDKDMGSPGQITQVIGRVLRQPGTQHYDRSILNTAHFYIRIDEKRVFNSVLEDVRRTIVGERGDLTMTVRRVSRGGERAYLKPRRERLLPTVSVYSAEAKRPIKEIVDSIIDFSSGGASTVGGGTRIHILQNIGSSDGPREEWVEAEHSNPVMARAIFCRELRRIFSGSSAHQLNPINLCDVEAPKFDAMVEYNSPAAKHLREKATAVVDAYIEHSVIIQNPQDNPRLVDAVPVDGELVRFRNALHQGYSGLNQEERKFAEALDRTQRVWCRNPPQGGLSIPLLDRGATRTFNPDFLVWVDKRIVAIDTKGKHLIHEDATRKLFQIERVDEGLDLVIRLVTAGEWQMNRPTGQISRVKPTGHTVWLWRQGMIQLIRREELNEAVRICLMSDGAEPCDVIAAATPTAP